MNEDRQAQLLAEWLQQEPGTEPPQQLDRDAIEAVYALRPDLAPAPSLSIDEILDEVAEGPLARPAAARDAEEAAAVTALVAWLEERPGVRPPADSDPDVVEAVYALRPDLAPAPDVDLDELFASLRSGPFAQDRGTAGPAPLTESEGLPPDVVADPDSVLYRDTVVDLAAAANRPPARRRGLPAWAIPGLGAIAVAATALLFVVPRSAEVMDAPTPFAAAETLEAKREEGAKTASVQKPTATPAPAAAARPRGGEAEPEEQDASADPAPALEKSQEALENLQAVGYFEDGAEGEAGFAATKGAPGGSTSSGSTSGGSTSAGYDAGDSDAGAVGRASPQGGAAYGPGKADTVGTLAGGSVTSTTPSTTVTTGASTTGRPAAPPPAPSRSYAPPTEAWAAGEAASSADAPAADLLEREVAEAVSTRSEADREDADAPADRKASATPRRQAAPELTVAKEESRQTAWPKKRKDSAAEAASAPKAEEAWDDRAGADYAYTLDDADGLDDTSLAQEPAPRDRDEAPAAGPVVLSETAGATGDAVATLPGDLDSLRRAANPVGALPDPTLGRPDVAVAHQAARDADTRGDDAGYIAALRPLLSHGTVAVAQDAAWRIARRQTSLGQLSAARNTIATGLARGTSGPWAARLYALQGELAERQGDAAGAADAYRRAIQAR